MISEPVDDKRIKGAFQKVSDDISRLDNYVEDLKKLDVGSKISDIEKDIEKIKDDFFNTVDDLKKSFSSDVKSLKNKINQQEDVSKKIKYISALEEENIHLNKDFFRLKKEVQDLKDLFEKNKNSNIFDEISFLKRNLNDANEKLSSFNNMSEENNFLRKEIIRLSGEIYKISKDYKDQLANDKVLYSELKKLNDNFYEDKKLDIDRIKLQKKVDRYQDKKILEFRTIVLYISCGVLAFLGFFYFYFSTNTFAFPGIYGKVALTIMVLLVLLIVLFLPWKKIINWFRKKRFFSKGGFEKVVDYFDKEK